MASGLTQKELGTRLGIGQATIACYESGLREPHIGSLIAYADLFDCSVDYLVGRADELDRPFPQELNRTRILNAEELELLKKYRSLGRSEKMRMIGYLICLSEEKK